MWRSIADGVVVRIGVSVIAIWFVFSCVFIGLFCIVRVVVFDEDFLSRFGCFWFGKLMAGRYREAASCPNVQTVPSNGSLLLLLLSCSRVSEISGTL